MKINFKEALKEFIETLQVNKHWVLATSADNLVTARTVSIINEDEIIFFQTDKMFVKYEQIQKNPQVALCCNNFQVEALATDMGPPTAAGNAFFLKKFKEEFPISYKRYSYYKNEVLIKAVPKKIIIWKYIDSLPFRDFIDLEKRSAERVEYTLDLKCEETEI